MIHPRRTSRILFDLVRLLADPEQRRFLVKRIVTFLLGCAVVPLLFLLPGVVGKMLAIGVSAALAEDLSMLGRALIVGPEIIYSFFGGVYLLQLLLWLVGRGERSFCTYPMVFAK